MEKVLRWGKDEEAAVSTMEELDELLQRAETEARATQPFLAELTDEHDRTISIGLGRDESVVNFSDSVEPPYYISVAGDEGDDRVTVFYYAGHWSEFSRRNAVPVSEAKEAMRIFFERGVRPTNIDWEEA